MDWIGFSVDGATADVYEAIRPGADFKRLCAGIADMVSRQQDDRPQVILNFVMMTLNVHQLTELVRRLPIWESTGSISSSATSSAPPMGDLSDCSPNSAKSKPESWKLN